MNCRLEAANPGVEQAIQTAALTLETDKSRGYCLEMIAATKGYVEHSAFETTVGEPWLASTNPSPGVFRPLLPVVNPGKAAS